MVVGNANEQGDIIGSVGVCGVLLGIGKDKKCKW